MTYREFTSIVRSFNLPFTYDSFPNNIAPNPPYIVFNYPNRNDFGADNINYAKVEVINLELYTQNKDFELEDRIETTLTQNGFYFEKNETYIRQENLYQISYVMESTF